MPEVLPVRHWATRLVATPRSEVTNDCVAEVVTPAEFSDSTRK